MTNDHLHELTAAYALDALDADEREAYETHLHGCDDCRAELASLAGTVGALAYATEGPAPAADLRSRIVSAARAEPPTVVALRPRRMRVYAATALAAAAAVGLAIGLWAAVSGGGPSNQLALRVQPSGVQLTARGFDPAPSGKVYEIWTIRDGTPRPVGVFRGGDTHVIQMGRLPKGTVVAVTVERAPRASRPTTEPISKTVV
ncbi:MAG TPA: anti-sigma factor [Gaiellaceae bacterium]|nr:anti-sigma factor [Gaiellaceae bacterium]